jgi:malonyl CoA-acyl carrier protein transacylase
LKIAFLFPGQGSQAAGLGEVGTGTVVSGLVEKTLKGDRVLNVEDPASLEKTVHSLEAA